jgi:uncharacterized membrane protein HdeD (DUF308 family)
MYAVFANEIFRKLLKLDDKGIIYKILLPIFLFEILYEKKDKKSLYWCLITVIIYLAILYFENIFLNLAFILLFMFLCCWLFLKAIEYSTPKIFGKIPSMITGLLSILYSFINDDFKFVSWRKQAETYNSYWFLMAPAIGLLVIIITIFWSKEEQVE